MPYLDKNFVIFYLVIYIFSIKNKVSTIKIFRLLTFFLAPFHIINKNLALKSLLYTFKVLYYKIIINDWPKKK